MEEDPHANEFSFFFSWFFFVVLSLMVLWVVLPKMGMRKQVWWIPILFMVACGFKIVEYAVMIL